MGPVMRTTTQPDTLAAIIAFLRTVPLFASLGDAELSALASDFSPFEYSKGDALFWHGESGTELYLLRRGKVRIYKISPGGRETSINIFSTGSIIGEFAAIDQQPRSATAQAIAHCLVWRMDGDVFIRRLRTMPDLALALNRLLVGKLRWTAEFAETVAQYDAAGRLLHILLLYNEQFGETLELGKQYKLELGLNQDDLASLVGARREWINRLLQTWQRQGWMEYKAGKMYIYDLPRMQQERDHRVEGDLTDQQRKDRMLP
jgi:CRP/FNR family cyclic AMP-dependent transcriptional regulator